MDTTIIYPTSYEAPHYEAICRLLGQLTTRDIAFTVEDYQALIDSPCSHLFLLEHEAKVVGMLTLGEYLSPTGSKAWIEDVVVDEACRGCGLGRVLVAHAMGYCEAEGIENRVIFSPPYRIFLLVDSTFSLEGNKLCIICVIHAELLHGGFRPEITVKF